MGAVGWIAPIATMIAALMTAANLGARVTGWGFVVFTIGSVGWSVVGVTSGQSNLLWTNLFLTAVNAVGIWRWLGKQTGYDDGGKAAAAKSEAARLPDLVSISSLSGRQIISSDGENIALFIDGMIRCDGSGIAYWVVSEGGVGGVGERLHAIQPSDLVLSDDGLTTRLSSEEIKLARALVPGNWPATL